MVLRILLIICLGFSSLSFARSSKKSIAIKKAKSYHAKKKYKKSNRALKKVYLFGKPKRMPVSALYLASVNYHKMGNHKSAIYYFNQLIKKAYLKTHIKVIKALKRDEVDEVKIPKTLKATYFYMGMSYYALYTKRSRLTNAKKAKRYFTICDEVDFNDKCADFLENLTDKQDTAVKSIKKIDFYISAASLFFQDRVNLSSDSGGDNVILANNIALCYGAGLRYGNSYEGYEASGCVYSGTANVQDSSGEVNYKQSGVPIAGFLLEGGYYIKPVSDDTRLGVSIPIMYRSGLYQEPSGFSIEGAKEYKYGIMLNAGWEIWILEMQMKLGHMSDTNLFMLQGVINF
jgi:hypothetical protein